MKLFLLLLLISSVAEAGYVLTLQDGTELSGEITDFVQDAWLDLRLPDGTTRRITWAEIRQGAEESAPAAAPEAPPSSTYLGVMGGEGNLSYLTFGARVGTAIVTIPDATFSLGVVFGLLSHTLSPPGYRLSARTLTVLADLTARRLWGSSFYIGTRVGVGLVQAVYRTGSAMSLTVGPVLGYEYALSPSWSLGADASFLLRTNGRISLPGIGNIVYRDLTVALVLLTLTLHW